MLIAAFGLYSHTISQRSSRRALRFETPRRRVVSWMQDHFAHRLATREHLQRVGCPRQRKSTIDMRGNLAFRRPLHELFQVGAVLLRIEPRPMTPEHAADIAALSSARLSGIFGMSPAANPITRNRPSHAIERRAASA